MLAVASSFGAVAVLISMYLTDMLSRDAMLITVGLVFFCCVVFLGLLASGANHYLRDPSLTSWQVIAATLVLLVAAYYATAHGHSILLMTIPVAFGFASFRHGSVNLLRLFGLVALMTAIEVGLRVASMPAALWSHTVTDLVPGILGMLVVLGSLAVTGGKLNDMRRRTWAERISAHVAMGKLDEAVLTLSASKRVRFFNSGSTRLFDVAHEKIAGASIDTLCQFAERSPVSEFLAQLSDESKMGARGSATPEVSATIDGIIRTQSGVLRNVELSASVLTTHRGVQDGFVLVVRDTTEREELIENLRHAATHDVLTGLLNRRGFTEAAGLSIGKLAKSNNSLWAIAIDLNRFKVVNDACGHQAGDELLKQVARMMRGILPKGAVVSRLGGDEFGVLLQCETPAQAIRVGESLLREFADMRFSWDDRFFKVGASIGLAEFTEDCINVEELLSRADSASYLAKERGANRVQSYSSHQDDVAKHQTDINWVSTINRALETNRFVLYAQRIAYSDPEKSFENDKFELLIRMLGDDDQVILPALFLPSAERFGLIEALDRHVISMAMGLLGEVKSRDVPLPQISINLSPNSLRDPDLLAYIESELIKAKLPGELFTFELTETAAIFDLEQAIEFFGGLRRIGCQIALDDVGSGFNSFYNMRQLPLDQIKIDGSYVRSACENALDRVFVESVQRIAETLGVRTVAEFVENDQIRATMFEIGVDFVQGFALHKPEPLTEVLGRAESNVSIPIQPLLPAQKTESEIV